MAKVLLVEDDKNLREIYEARLQAEGYEISSANDGEEALVVAKEKKPDLIIADVMMPKISGFEMLDILKNTEGMQGVKIIMLTALGQAEDQQKASSLGADRYLVKSQVTLEDIVNAAHELLEDDGAAAPAMATAQPQPEAKTPETPAATPTMDTTMQPSEPVSEPVQAVETPTVPEPEPMAAPAAAVEPAPETMPALDTTMDKPADQSVASNAATDDKILNDAVTSLGGSDAQANDPMPAPMSSDMSASAPTDSSTPMPAADMSQPSATDSSTKPAAQDTLSVDSSLGDQLAKENMAMKVPEPGAEADQGTEPTSTAPTSIEPKPEQSSDPLSSTDSSVMESNSGSSMKVLKPIQDGPEKKDINTLIAQENMNPTPDTGNTPPAPTDPDQAQVVAPDAGAAPTQAVSPNDVAL